DRPFDRIAPYGAHAEPGPRHRGRRHLREGRTPRRASAPGRDAGRRGSNDALHAGAGPAAGDDRAQPARRAMSRLIREMPAAMIHRSFAITFRALAET